MNPPPFPEVTRTTFAPCLRYAIQETWKELRLLESNPTASAFRSDIDYFGPWAMRIALRAYLNHMVEIGRWRTSDNAPSASRIIGSYHGQALSDEGNEFQHVPVMRTLRSLDSYTLHHVLDWDVPADGVFDAETEAAILAFQPWDQEQDRQVDAFRAASEATKQQHQAAAQPIRHLPHAPHVPSLDIIARAAADSLRAFAERLPGSDGLGDPTPAQARSLAEQHLITALVGHWRLAAPADTRAALGTACAYARIGLPSDPVLHAWTYEQWQQVAIAAGHTGLADTLWGLALSTWDTNRIRPVNWLICRIRILDLLHHGGSAADLRGLLEMSWLGLFADPLPSELAADTPLMQSWHGLLAAIIERDVLAFDRGLAERQRLLAEHWTRGGGLAAVSLADLGGLALMRTARLRGMQPTVADFPYLPADLARD